MNGYELDEDNDNENEREEGDPSVPADLIELHVALDDSNMTLEEFRKEFNL